VVLDRTSCAELSEAFLAAARRVTGAGLADADARLVASARAILRDGGRRPDGQPAGAQMGGPEPADEDVAARIWPERPPPHRPGRPAVLTARNRRVGTAPWRALLPADIDPAAADTDTEPWALTSALTPR
jgi:hypothetical protein